MRPALNLYNLNFLKRKKDCSKSDNQEISVNIKMIDKMIARHRVVECTT